MNFGQIALNTQVRLSDFMHTYILQARWLLTPLKTLGERELSTEQMPPVVSCLYQGVVLHLA